MTTRETATAAIELAKKHASNGAAMQSSAVLCLSDAVLFRSSECYGLAKDWAIRSLSYSVGMFHADYKKASAL